MYIYFIFGLFASSLQESYARDNLDPLSNYKNDTRFLGNSERLLSSSSVAHGCFDSEEVHLSAPDLIKKRGFPFEAHTVKTEDNYSIQLHRIPAPGKPVVVGYHGMFQSSRDFLMNCGRKPFAYKMWDAGYDVWLANVRGNCYSRCHSHLNPNDDVAYWNFTVDDVIKYDVPAIIDYILEFTEEETLNWVGYSLGSAVALGLGSVRPEYNEKINVLVLIGTTAYVGNTRSPLIGGLAPLATVQDVLMTTFNHGETLPLFMFPIMRSLLPILCSPEAKHNFLGFCSYFLFLVAGFDQPQSNPTIVPLLLGGTPQSLSVKMLSQWYQWINTGKFSYFDYGANGNMKQYGTTTPPNYDLTKVTEKVVNLWGQNDWLSVPEDVAKTTSQLPNVIHNIKVNLESWNHLDFIYGKDADIFVYDVIINILKDYT